MPAILDDTATDWRERATALEASEQRRKHRLVAGGVAGAIAVVLLIALVFVPLVRDDPPPAMCSADTGIQGLEGPLRHANGISEWNGGWLSVLTGIPYVAAEQRSEVAEAALADDASYEHLLTTLDPEVRPAVDHLHALAVDPALGAASITWDQGVATIEPGTLLAIQTVAAAVTNQCGYML